jgi:hypothetical protein
MLACSPWYLLEAVIRAWTPRPMLGKSHLPSYTHNWVVNLSNYRENGCRICFSHLKFRCLCTETLLKSQITRRVATAAFWRTFHHDGKISPGWWGGGVYMPIPFPIFTITYKAAVNVRSSWMGRYTHSISSPIYTRCVRKQMRRAS